MWPHPVNYVELLGHVTVFHKIYEWQYVVARRAQGWQCARGGTHHRSMLLFAVYKGGSHFEGMLLLQCARDVVCMVCMMLLRYVWDVVVLYAK